MPLNTPTCVAKQITQLILSPTLNGRVVYVAGGRGFDTECGVEATRPQWMGEANNKIWERGQEILGLVSFFFFFFSLYTILSQYLVCFSVMLLYISLFKNCMYPESLYRR